MEVNQGVSDATASKVSDQKQVDEGNNLGAGTVDYNTHKKLLGQMKKTQELNESLANQLKQFQDEKKSIEEQKLEEQGEFKKLLELRQKEVDALKSQVSESASEAQLMRQTLDNAAKLQAVYDKLPGKLKNNQYANFIDLDKVAINPETNEIDTQSVDSVVNSFMEEHSALVDTSHIGRLPNGQSRSITPIHHRFKDMSLKEMKGNLTEAVRAARKERGL